MNTLRGCHFFRLDIRVQRIMEAWWNEKHKDKSKTNFFPKFTIEDLRNYLRECFNFVPSLRSSIERLTELCSLFTLQNILYGNKILIRH